MFTIMLINPTKILFKGTAKSVQLPGENGTFEILSFHKRLISRLVRGEVIIDAQAIPIERGIAKVDRDSVSIVVEQ